jgi:hypothetical protein
LRGAAQFIAYLAKGIADQNMIREVHFPDVPSKFPVRISREFGRKEPLPRGLLGPERRAKSPKTAIFPVLSLNDQGIFPRRAVRTWVIRQRVRTFCLHFGQGQKLSRGIWRSFSPRRTGESRLTPDSPLANDVGLGLRTPREMANIGKFENMPSVLSTFWRK